MKLLRAKEGNYLETEQELNCLKCKNEVSFPCYFCKKSDCVICKSCQFDKTIKKMCPYENEGTQLEPHIHSKIIGRKDIL